MSKNKSYNKSKRDNTHSRRKRIVLLTILVLILLSAVLLLLERKNIIKLPFISKVETVSEPQEKINYDPPTEQEKTETEQFKDKLGEQSNTTQPSTPTSPGSKKSVTPVMTSWTASPNIDVRGFVPGIIEEGGTCMLTLTKEGQKVTESKAAIADASSVTCGLITVVRPRVSAGKWTAVLSYSSKSYEGSSTSNTIEVE